MGPTRIDCGEGLPHDVLYTPEKEKFNNKNTALQIAERAVNDMLESMLESLDDDQEVDRSKEVFRVNRDEHTYEVFIESDVTLEDYEKLLEDYPEDWEMLLKYAEENKGKTVVFINPTLEGGGVAMLRPPLVHLLQMLGVDAHWYVMEGKENPKDPNEPDQFIFTKLMHNIFQRRTNKRITEDGKKIHKNWCARNAKVLTKQDNIKKANVIVIDDPQPSDMFRELKKANPDADFGFRNHIDTSHTLMSDPSTPQGEAADYILNECGIKDVDFAVAHPVKAFMHPGLEDRTYAAPATIEPKDDLNRLLDDQQIAAGVGRINRQIAKKNKLLPAIDRQSYINPHRRQIALVARFDESKGMDIAMELGAMTRQVMREMGVAEADLPQIIIVGNGSVDDPSGIPVYNEMLAQRREERYDKDREDIILMRLKHDYEAMNALMYLTPGYDYSRPGAPAKIALQTSRQEGLETRLTDWKKHKIPTVKSNRGGMSLQDNEPGSGIVLDYDRPDYDLPRAALYIAQMMTDPAAYTQACEATEREYNTFNSREFSTVANAIRWLRIFSKVEKGEPADFNWKVTEGLQEAA